MSRIEGKLEFKNDFLFIDQTIVHPGSVIELKIEDCWVEVCVERTLNVYYSIPSVDLFTGLIARMDE